MTEATNDATTETEPTAMRPWNLGTIEQPLELIANSAQLLYVIYEVPDVIRSESVGGVMWAVRGILNAHGELQEAFQAGLAEMRHEREVSTALLAEARATKAAPGSREAEAHAQARARMLVEAAEGPRI